MKLGFCLLIFFFFISVVIQKKKLQLPAELAMLTITEMEWKKKHPSIDNTCSALGMFFIWKFFFCAVVLFNSNVENSPRPREEQPATHKHSGKQCSFGSRKDQRDIGRRSTSRIVLGSARGRSEALKNYLMSPIQTADSDPPQLSSAPT